MVRDQDSPDAEREDDGTQPTERIDVSAFRDAADRRAGQTEDRSSRGDGRSEPTTPDTDPGTGADTDADTDTVQIEHVHATEQIDRDEYAEYEDAETGREDAGPESESEPEPEPEDADEPDDDTGEVNIFDVMARDPVLPEHPADYIRSGTTPNAEEAPPERHFGLLDRLDLSSLRNPFAGTPLTDSGRDVMAALFLVGAVVNQWDISGDGWVRPIVVVTAPLAVLGLIAVYLLRTITVGGHLAPLRVTRLVRVLSQLPLLAGVIATLIVDAVTGDGVAVGVSLAVAGVFLAIEPRTSEGFLPTARDHGRARWVFRILVGLLAVSAVASVAVHVVALVGGAGLLELEDLLQMVVTTLFVMLPIWATAKRSPSWFVLAMAIIGGMLVAALADNAVRLDYAEAVSFHSGWVWLPFVAGIFALLCSRSWVRYVPLGLGPEPWRTLSARAFEFTLGVQSCVVVINVVRAVDRVVAEPDGRGPALYVLASIGSLLIALFAWIGRQALSAVDADRGRNLAVLAAGAMMMIGFVGVNVHIIAQGAAPSSDTGGVGLLCGMSVIVMLTVPAPIRERYGAPDFAAMIRDLRRPSPPHDRGSGKSSDDPR